MSMSQFAQRQADAVSMVDEFHKSTRKFNEEMIDLVRGRTQAGRNQGHSMVKYIMHSKWDPGNIIEESTRPAKSKSSKLRNERYTQTIVNSLLFETINHREDAIPQAYMRTSYWIFQEPYRLLNDKELWHSFPKWLHGASDDIYWITGKPGAGKSTLVKYILADPRLKSGLLEWSQERPLIVAGYFSWNAGTGLQKSHAGLIRTLLHQCLQSQPDLVPRIFPRRWAALSLFAGDVDLPEWGYSEILTAFKALVFEHGKTYNFAFVIDGLDEFEDNHNQLIELLQLINRKENVKICASSRPLNSFRDAFAQNPKLQLEHLTKKDIDFYVGDHFDKSRGFGKLKAMHPEEAGELLSDIVEKSKGVFLWVSVVVRLLLENLSEGDKVADLRKTLANLPDDLRHLFDHIWTSIDPKYYSEASRFFQMMNAAEECDMTVYCLTLYFSDDDVPIDMDINPVFGSFLTDALSTVQRRLSSRTRGILEVYQTKEENRGSVDQSARVDYLHRTAKEWVMSRWDELRAMDPEFDPFLSLLKGEANRMVTDNYVVPYYFDKQKFWYEIRQMFKCAAKVEDIPQNHDPIVQVLEKIDRHVSVISKMKDRDGSYLLSPGDYLPKGSHDWTPESLPHWCNSQEVASLSASFQPSLENDFLSNAARIPIPAYISAKACENPDIVTLALLTIVAFGQFLQPGPNLQSRMALAYTTKYENIRLDLMKSLLSYNQEGSLAERILEQCPFDSMPQEAQGYIWALIEILRPSRLETDTMKSSLTNPPSRWRRAMNRILCGACNSESDNF